MQKIHSSGKKTPVYDFSIRLTIEQSQEIEAAASRQGVSVSEIIRQAIIENDGVFCQEKGLISRSIRIPESLMYRVDTLAKGHSCSPNKQVFYCIAQWLERRKQENE